ncbi:hypothetical protein F5X68DRAFT_171241 [Plectosphaerella plurivora]|uniref:Zn(2)-C6 fungal-type domain-containing protein n=1 Tax=Plectosphaerella plurivora TaxID=936078 RepID=A0A9P9A718_9PEZI|nr:hypothetical protein F5X68DRAFT_171241 [Plectosphaerella plurivora]
MSDGAIGSERSSTPIETAGHSRRSHKKSRNGCRTCKKRKIKCDESRPECDKCRNFGVPCDFLPPDARHLTSASSQEDGRRKPGRPRGDWSVEALEALGNKQDGLSPSVEGSTSLSPAFGIEEMMVFHHYLTVTAPTIGQPHIWADGAPLLAKQHPGIFDVMLSISAFHLARTDILQAPKHLNFAEKHYAVAIKTASSMVAHVSINNAQAVYVITALISFTGFARGPKPGDLVLIANDGSVAWLSLLRGVRLIIGQFGSSVIFSGILDPNARPKERPSGCSCPFTDLQPRERRFDLNHPGWDWKKLLDKLSADVTASLGVQEASLFQAPIKSIVGCFEQLVRPRPTSDENLVEDFVSVMSWIWALDEAFIDALNVKERAALIILGFFGVLLKSIRGYWWLDGWGDHILRELRQMLGTSYGEWLP